MSSIATYPGVVNRTRNVPAGFEESICTDCGNPIWINSRTHESPVCSGCRRARGEFEARKLREEVRLLIAGDEPYDGLTLAERQEQLDELGITEKARPQELTVGIVIRESPTAEERRLIEEEDEQEHRERTLDREFAQVGE